MKKVLSFFILMLLPMVAGAETVEINGINYILDSNTKEAEVTSKPWFYSGYVVIPTSVIYDDVEYSVRRIGDGAFSGSSGLNYVSIPNSVTRIGERAFMWCSYLTSIKIPNSVTNIGWKAFYECNNLNSIKVDSCNSVYDSRNDCNAIIKTKTNELILGCKNTIIPNGVTSIRMEAFYDCYGLTTITIPNSVTSIGSSAFYGCSGLTSITIPNSVTNIEYGSFKDCSGLTAIKVEPGNLYYDSRNNCNAIIKTETNELFLGCMNTVIPNSISSIGNGAFYGCSGLTSITIPNSVTRIGGSAFSNCSSLTSITIPNSVTNIGSYAFYECSALTSFMIPNGLTSIEDDTFYGCNDITSFIIPTSVMRIGNGAFAETGWFNNQPDGILYLNDWLIGYKGEKPTGNVKIEEGTKGIADFSFYYCSSLTSVTIPNSMTWIGQFAFSGCSSLTSVAIPNGVTRIEYKTFEGCSGLTSVTIPNSVENIGHYAFSSCSNLFSFKIPKSVTTIGQGAFTETGWFNNQPDGILYHDDWLIGYKGEKPTGKIVITEGTRGIADYAFCNCSGMTSITIPNSVKGIGALAFSDCSGLTSVTIPKGVTSIDGWSFYGCSSMTSLSIGSSVKTINDHAFASCKELTDVYCLAEDVPITNIEAFIETPIENATLYVPAASIEAYKASEPWKNFKFIKGITPYNELCDVNGDGTIDVADIASIIDVMAAGDKIVEQVIAADVNQDGVVDVADIATIIDEMAGK